MNIYVVWTIRILVLLSVFVLPWWIVALVALITACFCDFYIELVIIGFCMDILYGTASVYPLFPYLITAIATIVFVIIVALRRRIFV